MLLFYTVVTPLVSLLDAHRGQYEERETSESGWLLGCEWVFLSKDKSLHPVDITHVILDELYLLHSCYNVSFKTKQSSINPKILIIQKPNHVRLAPKPNQVVLVSKPNE